MTQEQFNALVVLARSMAQLWALAAKNGSYSERHEEEIIEEARRDLVTDESPS